MLNNFKAKVHKWVAMSQQDLCKLIGWLDDRSAIEFENENLLIASVTNQRGELVGCVPFEKVFLVPGSAILQDTAPLEDRPVACEASKAIKREGQKSGVGKLLVVLSEDHPSFPGEKWVRVIEQQIPHVPMQGLDFPLQQSTAAYLN